MATKYQGTSTERSSLDCYIKLSRAANAAELYINKHLANYGLTISQFGVLEALYHLGPLHQHQLGEKILKTSGNMTMVIDNLCKRSLVERKRDENDRRYIEVHLSKDGKKLIQKILPKHVLRVVEAFGVLTASERRTLSTLCKTLGRAQKL